MSSQFGEHIEIEKYFADTKGRFLDLGAFDGEMYSNTWGLAQASWWGVLVEPSPVPFARLMQLYAGNDKIELVQAAIVQHEGIDRLSKFWVNTNASDAMSTLVLSHMRKFEKHHPYQKIFVPRIRVAELLQAVGRAHEFINVDVEGLNFDVLLALKEAGVAPRCICIECDPEHLVPRMAEIMNEMGLTRQERIGGNLLGFRP